MYIDSANLEEITELNKLGIFKGVTTNPTLLLQAGQERLTHLNQILALNIPKLFVQLEGSNQTELYNDYVTLVEGLSDRSRIAYKVPINDAGLLAIKKSKNNTQKLKF